MGSSGSLSDKNAEHLNVNMPAIVEKIIRNMHYLSFHCHIRPQNVRSSD